MSDGEELSDAIRDLAGHVADVAVIRDAIDGGADAYRNNKAPSNLVDAVSRLGAQTENVANAIMPNSSSGTHDAMGVYVSSLTEAVMGMTKALSKIGDAIESVAASIGKVKQS